MQPNLKLLALAKEWKKGGSDDVNIDADDPQDSSSEEESDSSVDEDKDGDVTEKMDT